MLQPRHLHVFERGVPHPGDEDVARVTSFTSMRSHDTDPFANKEDFLITAEQCAHKRRTCLKNGLTTTDAEQNLKLDGYNELTSTPPPTFLQLFLVQLTSFIIVMLIVAATASVVVTATGPLKKELLNYSTGIAIGILVLVNALIAAYTEHQAGGALDALAKMSQPTIDVIRNGELVKVDTKLLVRGELVVLGVGDVIPADIRVTESNDFKVNQAGLTGEPNDIPKNSTVYDEKLNLALPSCIIYSGCLVMNGKAKGIVVETGMATAIGKIAQLMADGGEDFGKSEGATTKSGKKCQVCKCLPDTKADQTPLQQNVEKLGAVIGVGAIILCLVLFIVGLILGVEDANNPNGATWLYMILISVTLAVAAIPEGIPLTLTIALSFGCTQMVSNNVLVRKIAAVETLGSASVICSDKTGTLTEGKMRMTQMYSAGKGYVISGDGFEPVGKFEEANTKRNAHDDISVRSTIMSALLCSSTKLVQKTGDDGVLRWEPQGNASEAPIIVAARKLGFDEEREAVDYPRVFEVPFNSNTKMMLTISKMNGRRELCEGGMPLPAGSDYLSVFKGAPNYILDMCTEILGPDGRCTPLTDDKRQQMFGIVDNYSDQALRVLAIAAKPLSAMPFDPEDESMSTEEKFKTCTGQLQLIGFVASIDPDRKGVMEAVETSRGAGVTVVMITGDYLKTAVAIAKNVKILMPDDNVETDALDCVSLRPDGNYLRDWDIDALTARVRVFARAKPEDKLEIVKSLQRQGQVTAMTGDGVNDAPALSKADIGVAMGIQGTEVAKGAADMVLRDDNFASIVKAVEKGRIIYAGIQKFVAFIMSVHIAEVVQICVCVMSGIPLMRTPIQILFLILVTDLPPSIALGLEGGEKSILLQKPRPKREPVVLNWMWVSICGNGILLSIVIVGVYVLSLYHYCEGNILQSDILPNCAEGDIACEDIRNGKRDMMNNARTVAFIALVWSENFRAYASRSFDQPFFVNLFGNKYMQYAVASAQVALYAAVLIPGFSDKVLELKGIDIGWWGWLVALAGPVGTLIVCELFKLCVTAPQMRRHEKMKGTQCATCLEEIDTPKRVGAQLDDEGAVLV